MQSEYGLYCVATTCPKCGEPMYVSLPEVFLPCTTQEINAWCTCHERPFTATVRQEWNPWALRLLNLEPPRIVRSLTNGPVECSHTDAYYEPPSKTNTTTLTPTFTAPTLF